MKKRLILFTGILFGVIIMSLLCSKPVFAAQTSGLTDGSVYNLVNKASEKCLNVNYGTDANGTNVNQYTKDGTIEQRFRLVYNTSRDSYKLYAMCSSSGMNRVIDIYRPIQSGANVDIWTPNDDDAQDLIITSRGNGYYSIHPRYNTNLALTSYGTGNGGGSGTTSTSTGNVFVATYTGANKQLWSFKELAVCYYSNGEDEVYYVTNQWTKTYTTNMGYSYFSHPNDTTTTQFLSELSSTGIFVNSAHGNRGLVAVGDNILYSSDIRGLPNGSLASIKLALLYQCYGADASTDEVSVLDAIWGKGAKCVIAWHGLTYPNQTNGWNQLFFEKIYNDKVNINNALRHADYYLEISYNLVNTTMESNREIKGDVQRYLYQ